jgi:hypothetical protein
MWQHGPFQSGLRGHLHTAVLVVRRAMPFRRLTSRPHELQSRVNVVCPNKPLRTDKLNLKQSINREWMPLCIQSLHVLK